MSEKSEHIAILKEQTELLRDLLKWIRFMGSSQVTGALNSALTDDKLRLAYQLSDGKNTSTLISTLTGISQPRISVLWRQWVLQGLGDTVSASGGSRFRRGFDLKALGIPVPEIKQEAPVEPGPGASSTGGEQNG